MSLTLSGWNTRSLQMSTCPASQARLTSRAQVGSCLLKAGLSGCLFSCHKLMRRGCAHWAPGLSNTEEAYMLCDTLQHTTVVFMKKHGLLGL